jgi:hypothetical protein
VKHWLAVAIGIVVVGAAIWSLRRQSRHDAEVAALRNELIALSSSVNRTNSEGARLAALQGLMLAASPQGSTPSAKTPEAPPPSASAPPSRPLTHIEIGERLQTAFEADQPDLRWSQQAHRAAEARLNALLPAGSTLRSFDCRASLCRIRTSHKSAEGYDQFVRSAFLDQTTQIWNAPGYSYREPSDDPENGAVATITYVAREGAALPPIDQ